jgi:hypothetical protein
MAELSMAALVFVALSGLSLLVLFVPFIYLLWSATAFMAVGLLFGLPMGIYYHLALRRELLELGPLPRGFWLRPHHHHAALDEAALRRVMPFWWMGGAGFSFIILGCVLSVVALVAAS